MCMICLCQFCLITMFSQNHQFFIFFYQIFESQRRVSCQTKTLAKQIFRKCGIMGKSSPVQSEQLKRLKIDHIYAPVMYWKNPMFSFFLFFLHSHFTLTSRTLAVKLIKKLNCETSVIYSRTRDWGYGKKDSTGMGIWQGMMSDVHRELLSYH